MHSLSMLRLAARAPRLHAPVTSTLGGMKSLSHSSSSSLIAVGPLQGTACVSAQQMLRSPQATVAALAPAGRLVAHASAYACAPAHRGPLTGVKALGPQAMLGSAHVLRRSRVPIEVTRTANSACDATLHLQALASRWLGSSIVPPGRLIRQQATRCVGVLRHPGEPRLRAWPPRLTATPKMPPNLSVNRSANGWPPCPRAARCPSCASRARRPSVVARLPLR